MFICTRNQIFLLQKSYQNMGFLRRKSVLCRNKFEIASLCSFLKCQTLTKKVKRCKLEELFVQNFSKHVCRYKNKLLKPGALILVLLRLLDNVDSKVEYRFPLSLKLQCNLQFWPSLKRKLILIFCFEREEPNKNGQRNFQPITGSLLRRQHVVILTSQKQSKETENRDTS